MYMRRWLTYKGQAAVSGSCIQARYHNAVVVKRLAGVDAYDRSIVRRRKLLVDCSTEELQGMLQKVKQCSISSSLSSVHIPGWLD